MLQGKNIIILLKAFVLGGAERQALALGGYLQNQKNCNVYVYSYLPSENPDLFYKECEKYQLNNLQTVTNPLSTGGSFKSLKKRVKLLLLGKRLRQHKPDVIIPYLNPPSIIASFIFKLAGAQKTFWHHRGVDYYRNDTLETKAAKRVPLFVANSRNGVEELKRKLSIQSKAVHYLPNFSIPNPNAGANQKDIRESYNIDKKAIVIGMVGHFRPEKLQQLLLDACLPLFKQFSIHVVFVGNKGEEEAFQNIESFIHAHSLASRVSILQNTNSFDVLSMFDIGVLLSENEGMPNAVMEYMAHKLPVVTNAHEGCLDLLGLDYESYTENSAEQVRNKLEVFIQDKELRKEIGKRNEQRIAQQFSIENYVKQLETLLYH